MLAKFFLDCLWLVTCCTLWRRRGHRDTGLQEYKGAGIQGCSYHAWDSHRAFTQRSVVAVGLQLFVVFDLFFNCFGYRFYTMLDAISKEFAVICCVIMGSFWCHLGVIRDAKVQGYRDAGNLDGMAIVP